MVEWVKKFAPGVSSSAQVAADQFNQILDYITDVDLGVTSQTIEPSVNTETRFRPGKLRIWSSLGNAFSYVFTPGAITADRQIILPLLTGNDTVVFNAHEATLSNKTIDLGTNNLISTGALAGGIPLNDGTNYENFARGATDTVLTASATTLLYKKLTNANLDAAAAIDWTKVSKTGAQLTDFSEFDIDTPLVNQALMWDGTKWTNATPGLSSEAGVATASNIGTAGVGVWKSKVGSDIKFKKINSTTSTVLTVTDNVTDDQVDLAIPNGSITNTQISASAAIAYSKLNLTGQIQAADFAGGGTFPYSSLDLGNSIVNDDINTSAAIAGSKLNLTNYITNTHINASAAIAQSKLALDITNTNVNASAGIAWSKISKTGSSLSDIDNTSLTGLQTGHTLSWDGTNWINSIQTGRRYDYIIVKVGTSYYCFRADGTVAYGPDSDPDDVFQDIFDELVTDNTTGISIGVAAGQYIFSSSFPGLIFSQKYTALDLSPMSYMFVPNDFAGTALKIQPSAANSMIQCRVWGGKWNEVTEAASVGKDWEAVRLDVPASGTSSGNQNNFVGGYTARNAKWALVLGCQDSDAWNNSSVFQNINAINCTGGINFDQVTRTPIGTSPFDTTGTNRHIFRDITIQPDVTDVNNTDQIDNVRYDNNTFMNVQTADVPLGLNSIHILATANFTHLIDGAMTYKNWRNESWTTIINGQDEMASGPFNTSSRQWGLLGVNTTTGGMGLLEGCTNYVTPTLSTNDFHAQRRYQTTTTINTQVGFRTPIAAFRTNQHPAMRVTFQTDELTNNRCFIGWTSVTGAITPGDNWGNNTYTIGFYFRPSDTNWQIYQDNNSANAEFIDTGIPRTGSTSVIKCVFLTPTWLFWRIATSDTNMGTDRWHTTFVNDIVGQNLSLQAILSNSAAENKNFKIGHCAVWAGRDS